MGPVLQVMEMMRMTIMTRTLRKIEWSGTSFIGDGDSEDGDNVINCPSR